MPKISTPSIPWVWTKQKELAAKLVAEGQETYEAIAAKCDTTDVTLWKWRTKVPEFAERVDDIASAYRSRIRSTGLAIMEHRVKVLKDMDAKVGQVFAERAADPEMQNVPGGKTGLMVRTLKGLGEGKQFQIVEEYAIDTPALRERRAIMQQAAQELGQWEKRSELSGMKARIDENGVVTVEMFRAMLDAPTNGHGQLPSGMDEAV
jgi:transposase-like protein